MFRVLCIFIVVGICGCTLHQQSNTFKDSKTFKERYNIYADPKPDYSNPAISIPNAEPYPALAFEMCEFPISTLEDFVDAIIRRMDAKNLAEYHVAQNRLDTLYWQLRNMLKMSEGQKTLYTWPEGHAYRYLLSYYMIRDEFRLKSAFGTVQYMKYQRTFE